MQICESASENYEDTNSVGQDLSEAQPISTDVTDSQCKASTLQGVSDTQPISEHTFGGEDINNHGQWIANMVSSIDTLQNTYYGDADVCY